MRESVVEVLGEGKEIWVKVVEFVVWRGEVKRGRRRVEGDRVKVMGCC